MNTHTEYRRHGYRAPETSVPEPHTEADASALARYRDPSLSADGKPPASTTKGLAWVRPTEFAAYVTPIVGRGVDLHSELIRRARRTPATTTRALQRGAPRSPAPALSASGTEGLSL